MTLQEVTLRVNETLHQGFEIPLENLKPEANLFTDLKLDSLDAIDLLVYLEEKMNIKVEADIFKEVRTLGDVYNMVVKLTEEGLIPTPAPTPVVDTVSAPPV